MIGCTQNVNSICRNRIHFLKCAERSHGRSGDRIPVRARFSAPVHTGPKATPASYAMGTVSLCRGVKRPGRGVNHPPTSSDEDKERVQLYLYSPFGPSWPVLGRASPLPFQYYCHGSRTQSTQKCIQNFVAQKW
jgi:hypothetical protein